MGRKKILHQVATSVRVLPQRNEMHARNKVTFYISAWCNPAI
jgi:hypothetical protein